MIVPSPDIVEVRDRRAWNEELEKVRAIQTLDSADPLLPEPAGERIVNFVTLLAQSLQPDPSNVRLKIKREASYLGNLLQLGNLSLRRACLLLEAHWVHGDVVKDWRESSYQ